MYINNIYIHVYIYINHIFTDEYDVYPFWHYTPSHIFTCRSGQVFEGGSDVESAGRLSTCPNYN